MLKRTAFIAAYITYTLSYVFNLAANLFVFLSYVSVLFHGVLNCAEFPTKTMRRRSIYRYSLYATSFLHPAAIR
jgi:hypothetical protein